jgi:hypothetical protein
LPAAEKTSERRLFNNRKTIQEILVFIVTIEIRLREEKTERKTEQV